MYVAVFARHYLGQFFAMHWHAPALAQAAQQFDAAFLVSYVARQFVDGGRALAQVVTQRGKAHFQRCICLGGFIQHHFQMHARVDFRMVLGRLRHAVQTVNFRQ